MAKAIVRAADLPPYAQPYVQLIESFGFTWKFVEEHRLAHIGRRVQVRDIGERAPSHEVAEYAQALRRGDQFPPVILTTDGSLVDGNTRTDAADKIGWRTFPAFVLNVSLNDAPESVRNQLISLGAGFNATHGKRMTAANFAKIINTITVDTDTPKDIAKRLHIKESTANTLLNAAKAKHRAARLGVELNGSLTNSHLKLFGGKSQQFTDEVFREFLQLTQDAKLTITATNDLAKRLAGTGTVQERLVLLADERRGYRSVIEGRSANPTRAAKLRQSLGFLNGVDDPATLAELDPHASRIHIAALKDAMLRLEKVVNEQVRVERTRVQEG